MPDLTPEPSGPVVIEFSQIQSYRLELSRDQYGQLVHAVDPDLDPDAMMLVLITLSNLLPGSPAAKVLSDELDRAYLDAGLPDPIGVRSAVAAIRNPWRKT